MKGDWFRQCWHCKRWVHIDETILRREGKQPIPRRVCLRCIEEERAAWLLEANIRATKQLPR